MKGIESSERNQLDSIESLMSMIAIIKGDDRLLYTLKLLKLFLKYTTLHTHFTVTARQMDSWLNYSPN